jgi:hypothetical protein
MNKPTFLLTGLLVTLCALPSHAEPWHKHIDKPWKNHKRHKKEVHVIHHDYKRSMLPETAVFLAIAGITYAVVDGKYYKEGKDRYIYVERENLSRYRPGQIVKRLPEGATVVHKKRQQYFVSRGDWFLPLDNGKYVVVAP